MRHSPSRSATEEAHRSHPSVCTRPSSRVCYSVQKKTGVCRRLQHHYRPFQCTIYSIASDLGVFGRLRNKKCPTVLSKTRVPELSIGPKSFHEGVSYFKTSSVGLWLTVLSVALWHTVSIVCLSSVCDLSLIHISEPTRPY